MKIINVLPILAIIGLCLSAPADATTFVRMSLEKLTATNSTVVVGEVVDAYSYWNADGTFILTDVVIEKEAMLKGRPSKEKQMTVTLMGGQVGDLTTVIVSGANLEIGNSYVLFTSKSDLPGTPSAMTVRDHSQGVFDIFESADGNLKAISQANSAHLVADEKELKAAPGGSAGIPLNQFLREVLDITKSQKNSQEVSR